MHQRSADDAARTLENVLGLYRLAVENDGELGLEADRRQLNRVAGAQSLAVLHSLVGDRENARNAAGHATTPRAPINPCGTLTT